MAELLLELFSEEIPARMQARAADDLKGLLVEALTANGLTHETAQAHSTPRRLTVVISGIPEAQEDVREERRGPRADAPEKAIEGFLKGAGVSRDRLNSRRPFELYPRRSSHCASSAASAAAGSRTAAWQTFSERPSLSVELPARFRSFSCEASRFRGRH